MSKYELNVYNDNEGVLKEAIVTRFRPGQPVWIVKKKRKKVIIYLTKVDYISIFSSPTLYCRGSSLYCRYHIQGMKGLFWDNSKDIFDNKDDAYEYAEKLERRINITEKNIV